MTFREYYLRLDESPVRTGSGFVDPMMSVVPVNIETTKEEILPLPEITKMYIGDRFFSLRREEHDESLFTDHWVDTQRDLTCVQFTFKIKQEGLHAKGVAQLEDYKSLARTFFYNYYLANWSFVLSDIHHSDQGEMYWIKLTKSALKNNFRVEIVGGETLKQVSSIEDLHDVWSSDAGTSIKQIKISR